MTKSMLREQLILRGLNYGHKFCLVERILEDDQIQVGLRDGLCTYWREFAHFMMCAPSSVANMGPVGDV